MRQLINAALAHSRTTLLLLVSLLLAGTTAWQMIPKEANPDVTIPMIYVSLSLEGVSPEDGERLLIRPMEQELRGIEGLRKFTAQSSEGHGSITLEFDPGFDPDTALPTCVIAWILPVASCLTRPMSRGSWKSTCRNFRC